MNCPTCHRPLLGAPRSVRNRDLIEVGMQRLGEQNGKAKLTDKAVFLIRRNLQEGWSGVAVAKAFGVSKSTIYKIKLGQAWRHVAA